MARPEKFRLGEILVQQKLLSQEQLQAGARRAEENRPQARAGFRRQGLRHRGADFRGDRPADQRALHQPQVFNIKPAAVRLLPEAQARRFRALVLEERDNAFRVGFADPTDLFAYDEVARILKREIELAVVTESQLLETVDRVYQRTEEITGLAKELTAELGEGIVDLGALALTPGLEEAPVVKLLQSVFEAATQVRASDIHIEPQERAGDPLPHRRRAARADRGRHEDRLGAGAAPEADVRPGHLGEAPAAGRPLQHQGENMPPSTCASRPCRRSMANRS
jgi:MSHA biogenesis protein MshE